MKTELEKYKAALNIASEVLSWVTGSRAQEALQTIHEVLNPPVEMDTVESVFWREVGVDDGTLYGVYEEGTKPSKGCELVKFTGTYQHPKKRTKEHSLTVNVRVTSCGQIGERGGTPHFKDYPEALGKTGTLTFTWTE